MQDQMIEHAKVNLRRASFEAHQVANGLAGRDDFDGFLQEVGRARERLDIHQHGVIPDGPVDYLATVGNLPKQEGCRNRKTVCFFF